MSASASGSASTKQLLAGKKSASLDSKQNLCHDGLLPEKIVAVNQNSILRLQKALHNKSISVIAVLSKQIIGLLLASLLSHQIIYNQPPDFTLISFMSTICA